MKSCDVRQTETDIVNHKVVIMLGFLGGSDSTSSCYVAGSESA